MDKVEELLSRAARYREMARVMSDTRTQMALLELAEEYESQAQALTHAGENGDSESDD